MAQPFTKKLFTLALACWTLFILGLLAFEIRERWLNLLNTLDKTADIAFEKDLLMRRWSAGHGGVYVPITDKTRPNPYLANVPDRDETTLTGKKLTLINPAYMIRQVHEMGSESEEMISHITGLKPLRPENRPDPWETTALLAFEQGRGRVSAVDTLNGKKYFRFMRPLKTEKPCLKCHAAQGYKEGDIRGGISISIRLEPFLLAHRAYNIHKVIAYGILWALGFGILFFGKRTLDRNYRVLIESEDKFSKAFYHSPMLMTICGIDDDICHEVNDEFVRISGFTRKEAVGKTCVELGWVSEADRQWIVDELNARGRVDNRELKLITKSGTRLHCVYSGEKVTINGKQKMLSIIQNITGRKQTEESLRVSEMKYRSMILNSPDLTIIEGMDGSVLYISPQAEKVAGHPADNFLGRRFFEFIHPDDRGKVHETMMKILSGSDVVNFEYRFFGDDGSVHWLSHTAMPIYQQGNIHSIQSSVRNITARKITEQELLRAKEFNENLIATANVIIVEQDSQGNVTIFNQTAEKITGYAASELTGRNWFEALVPADRYPLVVAEFQKLSQGGLPRNFESPILTKSGKERFISWQNNEISNQGELVGSISFGVDITEQKTLQEHLFHAQKMESIGTLAGGVAHDFNNILTVISGNASMMKRKLPDSLLSYLQQIEEASSRAASLTQSLLAFSRKQPVNLKPADINARLRNIRTMLARLIGEDINLTVDLSAQPLSVLLDAGQLDQAFINLVVNARDAMPDGGSIRITTRSLRVDLEFARANEIAPGYYAEIAVSDTGCGMDKATRDRIFEPFFTTKEVGKGTGLGLAMVYGAVKLHHGIILVQSGPNVGSTFTIYLPLMEKEEHVPFVADTLTSPRGSGTILLAEDEAAVRTITFKLLEARGYRVFTAVNGADAVNMFREHADEIDLVMLDVVMPKMNGKQAYDLIKQIRPDAKLIFATGYTDDILSVKGMQAEKLVIIQKPFTPAALFKTLDEQLNRD